MSWRSVLILNPARLSLHQRALCIEQLENGKEMVSKVPLEDISVIVIDSLQVRLSSQLLSALADAQIATFIVNESHLPNGVLLPYLSHSRVTKVLRMQLSLTIPVKKRFWQVLVRQKIENQSRVLSLYGHTREAKRLCGFSDAVKSGDVGNLESTASQIYFRTIFGSKFSRRKDCFYNAALNYSYAIIRAVIARTLCSYGFLPALGMFHRNETNAFNLADDFIEPYRPLIDAYVMNQFLQSEVELKKLTSQDKVALVNLLHSDIRLVAKVGDQKQVCSLLASVDTVIMSFSQIIFSAKKEVSRLILPSSLFM